MSNFPRGSWRSPLLLMAVLVAIAVYRAARGDWAGLAIFGVFVAVSAIAVAIIHLFYYIRFRRTMKKINRRWTGSSHRR